MSNLSNKLALLAMAGKFQNDLDANSVEEQIPTAEEVLGFIGRYEMPDGNYRIQHEVAGFGIRVDIKTPRWFRFALPGIVKAYRKYVLEYVRTLLRLNRDIFLQMASAMETAEEAETSGVETPDTVH